MSWSQHHTKSENYVRQAECFANKGEREEAIGLYKLAAEEEMQALNQVELHKRRTLGITAVSAVSLYYKAGEFRKAEQIAYKWLAVDSLPDFAIDQLQTILQTIWTEKRAKQEKNIPKPLFKFQMK